MKKLYLIALLLFPSFLAISQDEKNSDFDRLEVDIFVNFWDPLGSEIKSVNDVYVYKWGTDSYYSFNFNGFGQSVNPALNISYFITEHFGLSLGGNFLTMSNERNYNTGDTTIYLYNSGSIDNVTLGIVFRGSTYDNNFNFYYSFGMDYVTNYNFTMKVNNDPEISALGSASGMYSMIGMRMKLYKMVYLKSRMYYSFIPANIEFELNDNSINEETTLGGLGMMMGVGIKF